MSDRIAEWSARQIALLALESEEEKAQLSAKLASLSAKRCEEEGISVISLVIEEVTTSLYGRTCISLQRRDKKPLPNHGFSTGDEVVLRGKGDGNDAITGVVSKVTSISIDFVTENYEETEFEPPLRLDLHASEATYRKILDALRALDQVADSPALAIADIVFNDCAMEIPERVKITPFNDSLNESQIEAIEVALGSRHVALIHGPPGTGKTTAVVELIQQAVSRKQKVLVSAPSNVAVDNVLEKLVSVGKFRKTGSSSESSIRACRLGHPARVNPAIQQYCLEHLVSVNENTEIVSDVRSDIDRVRKKAAGVRGRMERKELYSELKILRKEARKREEAVVQSVIRNSDVIVCTCVGASSRILRDQVFDLVVIDEAAQALHAACWIPMLHSGKVCLAGDHHQLPPTVKSKAAENGGLGKTLFEQLMTLPDGSPSPVARMLNIQYRMNDLICRWSSQEMYKGLLRSSPEVENHDLSSLINVEAENLKDMANVVMLLVDTAGCDMAENCCDGGSHRNSDEAELVYKHVLRLTSAGLSPKQIGVITPYNGQLEELKTLMGESFPGLEIRTVDGFQGGEKEVICLSLVRSNPERSVGFLADQRRINVAVTRAKRHLAIFGDMETCSSDPFLGRLFEYVSEFGEHHSAMEYVEPSTTVHVDYHVSIEDTVVAKHDREPVGLPTARATDTIPPQLGGGKSTSIKSPGINKAVANRMIGHALGIKLPNSVNNDASSNHSLSFDDTERLTITAANAAKEKAFRQLLIDFMASAANFVSSRSGVISGDVHIVLGSSISQDSSYKDEYRLISEGREMELRVKEVPCTAFRNNFKPVLKFPNSMTSYDRMKVHELAEELGCLHISSGIGKDRYIEVTLPDIQKYIDDRDDASEISVSVSSMYAALEATDLSATGDDDKTDQLNDPKESLGMITSRSLVSSSNIRDSISESELLDMYVEKNEELQSLQKYRVSSKAMPNYDKIQAQKALKDVISEKQGKRTGSSSKPDQSVKPTFASGSLWNGKPLVEANSKKKFKKPPVKTFGGGALGTGMQQCKSAVQITREEMILKRLAALEGNVTDACQVETRVFRGLLKWNRQNFNVSIDCTKDVLTFKTTVRELTKVPLSRQKLMSNLWVGILRDDADFSLLNLNDDFVVNLVGSAD